jgi:hypothetical protein
MAKLGVIAYKKINRINEDCGICPYAVMDMEDFQEFREMFWFLYAIADHISRENAESIYLLEKFLGFRCTEDKRFLNKVV